MAKILLNKQNYFHNLKLITKQAGAIEKVAVVLKDNAYGHGILEIASLAKEFGIKNAVVRDLKEAKKVESFFEQILILADTTFHNYSHTFHIAVNSIEQLERVPENTNIHLKIDTGMHRNGISIDSIETAIYGALRKNLNITGIFTHYRAADELSCEFFWQRSNFIQVKKAVLKICEKLFLPIPKFHSANSSALFRFKNFDEDLARVGIACYGYLDTDSCFNNPNLKPVMSLWAKKLSTREIYPKQRIGYGGIYTASEKINSSTYDVGYGDGFFRLNGKKKYLTAKGYEILGRVSMDNCSINSTDEEVCIFDDVRQLAKIHDTITYEITTALKANIPREVI
ncbi:alanine racemase [Halarcobacter mediterraneus]|uniref:Alanine racemase n=1 Tax=Halarcobacter mediterraneus TaxID=2023153 RepID=A0A4Q1ATQ3_9BACT|nr:alanine racemase [Halarcobacter mediterraneus]RXK12113.1 alanine racemase [Halarcobacter mediterraneus]